MKRRSREEEELTSRATWDRIRSKALIVHPSHIHTLREPPKAPIQCTWKDLPRLCLLRIASQLQAIDVCSLALTCRDLRYVARIKLVAALNDIFVTV